jgi:small-conductance mechanosensitive channel
MIGLILFQSSGSGSSPSDAVDPSQVTGWDVAAAAAVVALAYPIAALLGRLTMRAARRIPNVPEAMVQDVGRLVRWAVYLIAFAVALTFLGVVVGWLSIVVVVILLLGVLMVRPMVENIAAGLLMTVRPAFAVGDQIKTDEYRGTVEEIGSRTTVLRTSNGLAVHIPNVEVAGKVIAVYTAYESRKAQFALSVGYATDLDALTGRLVQAITSTEDVEPDPPPAVQATGYEGGTITLSISFWYASSMTSDSEALDAVVRTVQGELAKAGVTPAAESLSVREAKSAEGQAKDHPSPQATDESSSSAEDHTTA